MGPDFVLFLALVPFLSGDFFFLFAYFWNSNRDKRETSQIVHVLVHVGMVAQMKPVEAWP